MAASAYKKMFRGSLAAVVV